MEPTRRRRIEALKVAGYNDGSAYRGLLERDLADDFRVPFEEDGGLEKSLFAG